MDTTTEKDTGMSLCMSRESKTRIECAAAVSGQSVSAFAASTLARAADDILERHNTIILGDEERDFFLALLDEDEEPSEEAEAAAARYNQGVRRGDEYHW